MTQSPLVFLRTPPARPFYFALEGIRRFDRPELAKPLEAPPTDGSPWLLSLTLGGMWNATPDAEGESGFSRSITPEVAAMVMQTPGGRLVLDVTGEGMPVHDFQMNHVTDLIEARGLDPERVFLLTSAVEAEARYDAWLAKTGRARAFRPVPTDFQSYFFAGGYFETYSDDAYAAMRDRAAETVLGDATRPHAFLSLNYSPRPNRYALLLHLRRNGLLDRGLVSFYGPMADNGPQDRPPPIPTILSWLAAIGVQSDTAEIEALHADCPIRIAGDMPINRGEFAYAVQPEAHYNQTYFSVVTESDFEAQAGLRITEKTLKPMAHLHPFVAVGMAGTLRELRKLGFLTFGPVIDESYDEIEDDAARLAAAFEQVDRIARWTPQEVHDAYVALWPAISHNHAHFRHGLRARIQTDPAFRIMAP